MTNLKKSFLNNEVLILSINGGFQRASIYRGEKVSEKDKEELRKFIKQKVYSLYCGSYKAGAVSDDEHVRNLVKLKRQIDKKFSPILKEEEIVIGVVQKLFNLYLKYQWCLGKCPPPPHCPFDAKIIGKLKLKESVAWTKMNDKAVYKDLVKSAKKIAFPNSIAEWELREFSRASDI